jgi:putative DNA primase/helicase
MVLMPTSPSSLVFRTAPVSAASRYGPRAIAAIDAELAGRIVDLARSLTGSEPTSEGRGEVRFRTRGSLSVCVAGARRGIWHDHEAGIGGGPIQLVAHLRGISVRDAFAWAQAWVGREPRLGQPDRSARLAVPAQTVVDGIDGWSGAIAQRLFREAVAPQKTPVELYLNSRRLELPPMAPLFFHPHAWRNAKNGPCGPAMVSLLTSAQGNIPVGIHLTYLRPDGTGKADGPCSKVMLGKAGVIRLVPDDEVTHGLGLAEGVETALATMQRAGWYPIWAATSAGGIARFPVVAGIESVTVFCDADKAGLQAAGTCCLRWAAAGREAIIVAPPCGDWDDALKSNG